LKNILFIHEYQAIKELFGKVFFNSEDRIDPVIDFLKPYDLVFAQGSFIERYPGFVQEFKPVPVIMVSGGEQEKFRRLAQNTGCKGFVPVPDCLLASKCKETTKKLIEDLLK